LTANHGQSFQIQQILTNLVATTIASSADKQCHLKVDVLQDDPELVLRIVVDSLNNSRPTPLLDGIGLDFSAAGLLRPREIANVYQGLVITREYLRLLGSRLDTSWSEDGGTLRFSFDLKVTHPRKGQAQTTTGDRPDNQSNYGNYVKDPSTVKVLLVEDNQVNMRIAKAILKRLGFTAETAENGLEAISKMHQEEYDIIFMVRTAADDRSSASTEPAIFDCRIVICLYAMGMTRLNTFEPR
jgi:hypothetical protein